MLDAFFGFRGRLGRLQYFLRSLGLGLVAVLLVAVLFISIVGAAHGSGDSVAKSSLTAFVIIGLALIPLLWSSLALQARRIRDIGANPVIVIPAWIAFEIVDGLIAHGAPSLSIGVGHEQHTLIGLLVNLAGGLCLLFWPGRSPVADDDRFATAMIFADPPAAPAPMASEPQLRSAPIQSASGPPVFGRRRS